MNRNDEYHALLANLDTAAATPPALADTVARAADRAKRSRRVHRYLVVPTTAVAVLFAAFVTTVNVSAEFARLVEQVPLLNKLAAALEMKPSVKTAIENDYGQTPDGLEQTENGITMKIEYVIAEQKNLTIFFSLRSDTHDHLGYTTAIGNTDSNPWEFRYAEVDGTKMAYPPRLFGGTCQNGKVRKIEDLYDSDMPMPDSVMLACKVHDAPNGEWKTPKEEDILASFHIVVPIDHDKIHPGETITLNQDIVVDGQKYTAESVEIHPTYLEVTFADRHAKTNTATLSEVALHAENEKGERFGRVRDGIGGTITAANDNAPARRTHRLESPFFSKGEHLTLYITKARLRDKNQNPITIDLAKGTATGLPEGTTLERAVQNGNSWRLIFSAGRNIDDYPFADRLYYNIADLKEKLYYDEASRKWRYPYEDLKRKRSMDFFPADNDEDTTTPRKEVPAEKFAIWFDLTDCPVDTIYLRPSHVRWVTLDKPVEIKVK